MTITTDEAKLLGKLEGTIEYFIENYTKSDEQQKMNVILDIHLQIVKLRKLLLSH